MVGIILGIVLSGVHMVMGNLRCQLEWLWELLSDISLRRSLRVFPWRINWRRPPLEYAGPFVCSPEVQRREGKAGLLPMSPVGKSIYCLLSSFANIRTPLSFLLSSPLFMLLINLNTVVSLQNRENALLEVTVEAWFCLASYSLGAKQSLRSTFLATPPAWRWKQSPAEYKREGCNCQGPPKPGTNG